MKGAARVGDEEPGAAALGVRLKAWFAALSGRPTPKRLLDHVDELERGQVNGTAAPGAEQPPRP